jgi:urease accessory protein UreE
VKADGIFGLLMDNIEDCFKWVHGNDELSDMAQVLGRKLEQQKDILRRVEEIGVLGLVSLNLGVIMNTTPQIGDIQKDENGQEWVVVGIVHSGVSRVRRNSLAHLIHAAYSPEIAKSVTI